MSVAFGVIDEEKGIVSSEPLLPATPRADGEPLFRELDPSETGLAGFANDYSSPHIWGKHWRTYLFGAIGTGVAVGDVDGDGLPDIFAVSKNEGSRLYRNLGDFRFEDMTRESGIEDGSSVGIDKVETPAGGAAFADVNGDGHLDLYLCYLGAANQLWINDGTGRFEERAMEWGVDVSTASVMGYFADYDGDGRLDLYVATNLLQEGDTYPGPKPDLLFRNTGERFVDTTLAAGIAGVGHAHAAVWWDYDGDGDPDLYVANDFAEADRLYRNNGDGTFEERIAQASPRAPYYAMGADFGDVNRDGRDDFWVADMAPTSRARYKRTLESHRHVYEGVKNSLPHQYMQNVLLLNLDGQNFADIAALAGLHRTDWTWAARLVDLDGDGWLDAFATNGMLRNFNDGDLGVRLKGRNNLRNYAQVFRPTPVLRESNLAFRHVGDLRFERIGEEWGLGKEGVSFGAAFADFDRDGSLDLVVSNFREPPSLHRSGATEFNRVVIELRGSGGNRFGIGARVTVVAGENRQSKTLYPYRGYMASDEPILHFGLGVADRIDALEVRWPSGAFQRLEGLEANCRYVVKEQASDSAASPSTAPRFEQVAARFPESASRQDPGFGEFARQPLLPFARERLVSSARAADVNSDGISDLILGGASGQGATTLLGGTGFVFQEAWSLDLEEDFPSSDAGIAVGDYNGDGFPDLAIVSGGSSLDAGDLAYQDRLYLGDGEGGFARDFSSAFSQASTSAGAVASADFDGDGLLDLFVGGGSVPGRFPEAAESTLWRGRAGGGFERVDLELAPGLAEIGRVTAAAWCYLRADALPDLVVLSEWGMPQLWRNRGGKLEREEGALGGEAFAGLWSSLAAGDFDGDGRMDLAVGNLGLNTGGSWQPSLGPRRLWWRPDGAGIQILETHEESGVDRPLAWLDKLQERMPELAGVSYSEFADGSARELFGSLEDGGFQALNLIESRSGIFWQESDGSFSFEPLPAVFQSGRAVALLAEDVDQDGICDLVSALESPSLAPWTGRAERGHIVLGLGAADRRFRSEISGESGLDIGAGSPRQLLWSDFDGDGGSELLVVDLAGEPVVFTGRR